MGVSIDMDRVVDVPPLTVSMNAFSIGLPGRMKARRMPRTNAQASKWLQVNSLPLSTCMTQGRPRRRATISVIAHSSPIDVDPSRPPS